MKKIQKRYIYSALLASIFFIITYAVLHINLAIAIILTLCIYLGGIFLFKKEDIREFDSKSVNTYYYVASRVQNEANLSKNNDIIKSVDEITKLTDEIIVSLSQRPRKVEQVFSFFDYYLDILYKILYKYNYINNNKEKSEEDTKFINSCDDYINKILESFQKQYKNMQESKIIDIENEIMIFEKNSGINEENVKVGDNNEQ